MPLWLGSTWLHGPKVSHPSELSRACYFGYSSIFGMVKEVCCLDVLGVSCCRNVSFPVILCSRKNWMSSTWKGRAEVTEAEVTCPGVTCWAFPGVGRGLDGWWSSDILLCVKHTPHGLCCVDLETSFQSSGSTFKVGSSIVIWGLWNGCILCHSGFSWRN